MKKTVEKKLTRAERRIAIFKDALSQLRIKAYIASPGVLCNLSPYVFHGGELQSQLTSQTLKKEDCHVCARGSLLLSTVRKENDFTRDDLANKTSNYFRPTSTFDKRLLKLFTAKQIASFEAAFEVNDYFYKRIFGLEAHGNIAGMLNYQLSNLTGIPDPLSVAARLKCIKFGIQYKDSTKRLRAIFNNAVNNNGIFKP